MAAALLAAVALRLCGGSLLALRACRHFAAGAPTVSVATYASLLVAWTSDVAVIALLHGALLVVLHLAARRANGHPGGYTPLPSHERDAEKDGEEGLEKGGHLNVLSAECARPYPLGATIALCGIAAVSLSLWLLGVAVIMVENDAAGLGFDVEAFFNMRDNLAAGLQWSPVTLTQYVHAVSPTLIGASLLAAALAFFKRLSPRFRLLILAGYLLAGSLAQLLAPRSYNSVSILAEILSGYRSYRRGLHKVAGAELDVDADFYGTTNIHAPLVHGFKRPAVAPRHIFHVLLESASSKALPFDPSFCSEHNCADADARYLTPEYMTPNFARFAAESVNAGAMLSSTSFSNKAHFASMCGTMQELKDWTSEFRHTTALPCLPELAKAADPTFETAMFSGGDAYWDHLNSSLRTTMGYETVASKQEILERGLPCDRLADLMCADDEILPLVEDWIDEKLAKKARMFLSLVTINLHVEYYSPARFDKQYTASPRSNRYLNSLHWTDEVFGKFIEVLRKRGLLEDSIIFVHGDHSDHLSSRSDDYHELGPHQEIYLVPFAMRMPGGSAPLSLPPPERFHYSLDILPTVLDALAVPADVISPYYGRSLLRQQPSPDKRVVYTVETPGKTAIMLHDGPLKLARLNSNGYFCAVDRDRDPHQETPLCFNIDDEGRRVNTLAAMGDADRERLERWADTFALAKFHEHLGVNARYWSEASTDGHARTHAALLDAMRGLLVAPL